MGAQTHINSLGKGIPPLWLKRSEVKELLELKQEAHEGRTLQVLAHKGSFPSLSGRIFFDWERSQRKIKEISRFLDRDRKLQTAVTNLIGAARLKATERGGVIPLSPRRGAHLDNWRRRKESCASQAPGEGDVVDKKARFGIIREYLT